MTIGVDVRKTGYIKVDTFLHDTGGIVYHGPFMKVDAFGVHFMKVKTSVPSA